MQINRRRAELHVAAFDRGELENVVDQPVHARSVLANDRKEALATLRIFHRAVFECFDKRDDRRQRRAQFV